MWENHKLNQKGVIAQALILILVVIGIIAGVYLVQKTQIFAPKASVNPITFKSSTGSPLPVASGIPQTDSPTVKVELTSPLGGPKPIQ